MEAPTSPTDLFAAIKSGGFYINDTTTTDSVLYYRLCMNDN